MYKQVMSIPVCSLSFPDTEKHNRPDVYFTEDEFDKYSVQPSWKELILQKEHELSVSLEDTALTRPPTVAARKDPVSTRSPTVVVRKDPASTVWNQVEAQPGKGRSW